MTITQQLLFDIRFWLRFMTQNYIRKREWKIWQSYERKCYICSQSNSKDRFLYIWPAFKSAMRFFIYLKISEKYRW